jgi:hypothetical protein
LVLVEAFVTFRGIFSSYTTKTILVPLLDYEEEEEEEEDDEDDEDEPNVAAADISTPEEPSTFLSESPTPRTKGKPVMAAGPFHHRLATPRDLDTHAKVAEALRKVDGPLKNHESSDYDEEEEEQEEDSEEEEEEMEEEEKTDPELAKRLQAGGEKGGEDSEEEVSLRWKSDLATKARDAFYTRQSGTANLRKLVYGQQQVNTDI